MNNLELEKMANEIRKDIVTAVHSAKSGHPGGSLSSADIFTYLSENKPLDKLIDWIFEMYQVSQEDKKEIEEEVSELLKRFISCEIIYIDNTEM